MKKGGRNLRKDWNGKVRRKCNRKGMEGDGKEN